MKCKAIPSKARQGRAILSKVIPDKAGQMYVGKFQAWLF